MYKTSTKLFKNAELVRRLPPPALFNSNNGVFGYKPRPETEFQVPKSILEARTKNSNFYRWVEAYRAHGHKIAKFNPIAHQSIVSHLPQLDPNRYGLTATQVLNPENIMTVPRGTSLEELETELRQIYCSSVGVQFAHVESEEELEWLVQGFERTQREKVNVGAKKEIAALLLQSQAWDRFAASNFSNQLRYGGEGAESMMAFFRQVLHSASQADVKNIVMCMPHRGRFNLLTTMLRVRAAKVFKKYKGLPVFPVDSGAMDDAANHLNASQDFEINGKTVHMSLLPNPAHLEAVNPVSMGKTRSKLQAMHDGAFNLTNNEPFGTSALNIQLHGDAAFTGQGIVQECLMMSGLPHFDIGGTIHMIVNNQLGSTTPANRGRRTEYCTDLAKSIGAPVFHVNGDDPEALTLVTRLAFDYRNKFRKDVFIDFNCWRRWGHNEANEPTFTNPQLYEIINNRKSVPDLYAEKLVREGVLTVEEIEEITEKYMKYLAAELAVVESYKAEDCYKSQWSGFQQAPDKITTWDTGVDQTLLKSIGETSISYPVGFNIHPHLLNNHIKNRINCLNSGTKIDFTTAEALAIGSLMHQGHHVRISGQDVGRGTLSQRHAMFVDQKTDEMFVPLNEMTGGGGGKLELAHSILSEEAVLGFEYGMAIDNPRNLIIWEAQFGDFATAAQVIIDTYFASGETKWMRANGLVMLLPHGYDGAASEHTSCRLERFLQMTDSKEDVFPDGDNVNMHIVNPSTPAQYFHALRRQMARNFRKPLAIVGPKTLLCLPEATSAYADMAPGTHFKAILGDPEVDSKNVKKIILCSGKHFYTLDSERIRKKAEDCAIIRVESLCPFPAAELKQELSNYGHVEEIIYSQEEHRNSGAWTFLRPRLESLLGRKVKYCGRPEAGTVATGVLSQHDKELADILATTFQ